MVIFVIILWRRRYSWFHTVSRLVMDRIKTFFSLWIFSHKGWLCHHIMWVPLYVHNKLFWHFCSKLLVMYHNSLYVATCICTYNSLIYLWSVCITGELTHCLRGWKERNFLLTLVSKWYKNTFYKQQWKFLAKSCRMLGRLLNVGKALSHYWMLGRLLNVG